MTSEQALNILIQAASLAPMPKAAHMQVEQAVAVIKKALEESK